MMRLSRAAAGVAFVAALALLPLVAEAQGAKLQLQNSDTMKTVLQGQMGQRVSVVLTTGPGEIAGVVTMVGDKVVHLSGLTRREFFDAVVALDQSAAVVVRVRQ